ncbi:MAG: endonuclease V [Pseudomonadales bacterium]
MKIPRPPHPWTLSPTEAVAVQRRLKDRVELRPAPIPERVVGLDCAFLGDEIIAVAVVWDVARQRLLERRGARDRLRFPYVPGLLSFREIPVLLKVLRSIRSAADGIVCDGQGIAHPRRFGLASHLGIIAGVPTLGCAKSRLCGSHAEPGRERGAVAPLLDGDERIGSVVRTRDGVRPLYVSPGHLLDHPSSVRWVLACGAGFRVPEPTRLADRLVAQFKRDGHFSGGMVRQ